jgi:hypothetical protein
MLVFKCPVSLTHACYDNYSYEFLRFSIEQRYRRVSPSLLVSMPLINFLRLWQPKNKLAFVPAKPLQPYLNICKLTPELEACLGQIPMLTVPGYDGEEKIF